MKKFSTLAEFKRILKVGDKLNAINHSNLIGRDGTGNAVYGDFEFPTREVSIKQNNSFALKTENADLKTRLPNGTFCDAWCELPAASLCKISNNRLTIFQRDARGFSGGLMDDSNPEYKKLPLMPIMSYWFAE